MELGKGSRRHPGRTGSWAAQDKSTGPEGRTGSACAKALRAGKAIGVNHLGRPGQVQQRQGAFPGCCRRQAGGRGLSSGRCPRGAEEQPETVCIRVGGGDKSLGSWGSPGKWELSLSEELCFKGAQKPQGVRTGWRHVSSIARQPKDQSLLL